MRPRRVLGPIVAAVLVICALPAEPFSASQQPRREEEEDPAPKKDPPPRTPRTEDEEPVPKTAPARRDPLPIDPRAEARAAKKPALRDFFNRIATARDFLTVMGGKTTAVGLLASGLPADGEVTVLELDKTLEQGTEQTYPVKKVVNYLPFERFVLAQVAALPADLTRAERLEATAKATGFALRFHRAALAQGSRKGEGWKPVGEALSERWELSLKDLLAAHREAKDWEKAAATSRDISATFGDAPPPALLTEQARTDLARLDAITAGTAEGDFARLREAVGEFERRTGLRTDPVAQRLRGRIEARIAALLEEVKTSRDASAVRNKLREVEAIDAARPEVATLRKSLSVSDPVLYVGVPRLPQHPSPIRARTEADRWAVELCFEGLFEAAAGNDGLEYRPRLVVGTPEVGPLTRNVVLRRDARWPSPAGGELDARDLKLSLDQYREHAARVGSTRPGGWDSAKTSGRYAAAMKLARPSPDALSLFEMKLLPGRYLKENNISAASDVFDRAPVGSGPYRYVGVVAEQGGREVAIFRANPEYAARAGQAGRPAIREVRFFVPSPERAAADFKGEQLHLWLDMPPTVPARLPNDPEFQIARPRHNRRVWVLAVNHTHSATQSHDLRRAVAHAIDRAAILRDVFQANATFSKPLAGPFPPEAWATPTKGLDALDNPELAAALFAKVPAGGVRLELAYSKSDPNAAEACRRMKLQIEKAATPPGGNPAVAIDLEPLDESALQRTVYETFNYHLAYVPIDYEDDRYDLSALVDDRVKVVGSRNYLGYPGEGADDGDRVLRQAILDMRAARDGKRLRELAAEVHSGVRARVPFVPLWQLDRPMAVSRHLKIVLDETGAERGAEVIDMNAGPRRAELWRLR